MLDTSEINSLFKHNEDNSHSVNIGPPIDIRAGIISNDDNQEAITKISRLLEIKQRDEKHQWRKLYLGRSFYLVGYILYISLSFLLFSAIGVFTISDNVLIALLTTMVANVLGVLAIAFYWLYQK